MWQIKESSLGEYMGVEGDAGCQCQSGHRCQSKHIARGRTGLQKMFVLNTAVLSLAEYGFIPNGTLFPIYCTSFDQSSMGIDQK